MLCWDGAELGVGLSLSHLQRGCRLAGEFQTVEVTCGELDFTNAAGFGVIDNVKPARSRAGSRALRSISVNGDAGKTPVGMISDWDLMHEFFARLKEGFSGSPEVANRFHRDFQITECGSHLSHISVDHGVVNELNASRAWAKLNNCERLN